MSDTSYSGYDRCFGSYECSCGRTWSSANSWRGKSQECLDCGSNVYAHTQSEDDPDSWEHAINAVLGETRRKRWSSCSDESSDDDIDLTRQHPQHLCQKCKELGYYCRNFRNKSGYSGDPLHHTMPRPSASGVRIGTSTSSRPAVIVGQAVQQYIADGLSQLQASKQATAMTINDEDADGKMHEPMAIKREEIVIKQEPMATETEDVVIKQEPVATKTEEIVIKQEPITTKTEEGLIKQEPMATKPEEIVIKQESVATKTEEVLIKQEPVVIKKEVVAMKNDPSEIEKLEEDKQ